MYVCLNTIIRAGVLNAYFARVGSVDHLSIGRSTAADRRRQDDCVKYASDRWSMDDPFM